MKDDEEKKGDDANGDEQDKQKDKEPKMKEAKVFDRWVKVPPKSRLKNIRKFILEDLGVQDICTARIYSCTKPIKQDEDKNEKSNEDDQDDKKDDEKPVEDAQEAKDPQLN